MSRPSRNRATNRSTIDDVRLPAPASARFLALADLRAAGNTSAACPHLSEARLTFDVNPPPDCQDCPRLADFRQANRAQFRDELTARLLAFRDPRGRLLIVGRARALRRADRTGRQFTGEYAG